MATAINDSGPRAEALAGLAPYLTVGERSALLAEALGVATATANPYARREGPDQAGVAA